MCIRYSTILIVIMPKEPKTYNVCEATKYVRQGLPVNSKTKARSMGYTVLMYLVKAGWVEQEEKYLYAVKKGVELTKEMLDSLVARMSKEPRFNVRSKVK